MGFFGAAHRWGVGRKTALPKIYHRYPTRMKLCTSIPNEDPHDISIFYQKSAKCAIPRNTDIDSISIRNF